MNIKTNRKGFTIVELLIVIVVISILATISIVTYNGIQTRARESKTNADLQLLRRAILAARSIKDSPLTLITNNQWTGQPCLYKPSGTDLASLPKNDSCWTSYLATLNKITDATNIDVRNLVDPYGRPYYIDENEGTYAKCLKDKLAMFGMPHVYNSEAATSNNIIISNYYSDC